MALEFVNDDELFSVRANNAVAQHRADVTQTTLTEAPDTLDTFQRAVSELPLVGWLWEYRDRDVEISYLRQKVLGRDDPAQNENFRGEFYSLPGENPQDFMFARNLEEVQQIRQRNAYQERTKEVFANSPTAALVSNLMAEFANPLNYIPVAGGAKLGMTATTALATAVGAIDSAMRQAADPSKTSDEDIFIQAGLYGAAAALFKATSTKTLQDKGFIGDDETRARVFAEDVKTGYGTKNLDDALAASGITCSVV